MWLLSPLSYPVPYVQMESTTQVTNVSFSYRTYQYQHMRTRQKRRKREKHIGSLYFEPSHHRHMGGKGENNMAPRGRHLIETKDQKMFIMSIVQKKRIRKHHVHRTTGKQDEMGEKIMAP